MTGKIRIKREDLFTLNERESRGHSLKICKNKRASKIQGCQSFSVRTINDWNPLPSKVVNTKTADDFKVKLDEHRIMKKFESLFMHCTFMLKLIFYSILFYSILFYSILFYSILFYPYSPANNDSLIHYSPANNDSLSRYLPVNNDSLSHYLPVNNESLSHYLPANNESLSHYLPVNNDSLSQTFSLVILTFHDIGRIHFMI